MEILIMEMLRRMAKNAINLEKNRKRIFLKIVGDKYIQSFIIDLNRKDQLFDKGEDAEGKGIGSYSAATEVITDGETYTFSGETKSKKQGDPIFLYDTGAFFRSFKIRKDRDGIYIEANTIKGNDDLAVEYGKQILGLSDESKAKLAEEILSLFIEETKNEIFKGVRK